MTMTMRNKVMNDDDGMNNDDDDNDDMHDSTFIWIRALALLIIIMCILCMGTVIAFVIRLVLAL